ncbi:MAG TPA: helix-turn-helix domain-containing protein [Bacteroidales bacterium]|nr:helix-turn-helix domain-containing protein [Bacteroidales bacterium]
MYTNFNSLLALLIFGGLVLLSFIIISNPLKVNRKANFWFGIFMLIWATFWLEEVLFMTFNTSLGQYSLSFLTFARFLTPLGYYFSVLFYTNPAYKFRKRDLLFLIPPILELVLIVSHEVLKFPEQAFYENIQTGMILLHCLFYVFASYLRIRKHQKRIELFSSNTAEINLNWLKYIIVLILSLFLTVSLYNLIFAGSELNVVMNLIFLFVIFSIAYYSLRQKEIFPFNENQTRDIISLDNPDEITKKKIVSDQELIRYKSELNKLMSEKKPFTDSELNLIKLAGLLDVTPHQLSYIINSGFNENFFQFINKFRVERAKQLLTSNSLNNYSIMGIAFESGFNSKTAFNLTFKKITNLTPSEYKLKSTGL